INSVLCSAHLTITAGTFSIAGLGVNSFINTLVLNSGSTLQTGSGSLFIAGGSSASSLVAGTNSTITFGNNVFAMNAGSSLTGTGLFLVGGGTLTLNVNATTPTNFQLDGGAVDGAGT